MRLFIKKQGLENTHNVEDMNRKQRQNVEAKMRKFCDHVLSEFRYLHRRLEDKIYLELGYIDKVPKLNDYFMKPAELDELLSTYPMSTLSWVDKLSKPRANSLHVFKR
jgi:hypothetical protein